MADTGCDEHVVAFAETGKVGLTVSPLFGLVTTTPAKAGRERNMSTNKREDTVFMGLLVRNRILMRRFFREAFPLPLTTWEPGAIC